VLFPFLLILPIPPKKALIESNKNKSFLSTTMENIATTTHPVLYLEFFLILTIKELSASLNPTTVQGFKLRFVPSFLISSSDLDKLEE